MVGASRPGGGPGSPLLIGGWTVGDDESTPTEMAQHDLHEMKREIDEANMHLGMASAFNATAEVMDSLGFDDAAAAASAGATLGEHRRHGRRDAGDDLADRGV